MAIGEYTWNINSFVHTYLVVVAIESKDLDAVTLANLKPCIVVVDDQVNILCHRCMASLLLLLQMLLRLRCSLLCCHHLLRSHVLSGCRLGHSCTLRRLKLVQVD